MALGSTSEPTPIIHFDQLWELTWGTGKRRVTAVRSSLKVPVGVFLVVGRRGGRNRNNMWR